MIEVKILTFMSDGDAVVDGVFSMDVTDEAIEEQVAYDFADTRRWTEGRYEIHTEHIREEA